MGDVGPKLDTYMPDRGAREVSFCSFLGQLSRKLDGSRTTVRSAEDFLGSVPNSSRGRERFYFFRPQTPWGSAALSGAF